MLTTRCTAHSQKKNYLQILFPILVDSSVQEQNNTKATFSTLGSYEASKITEIVKFTASQRSPVDKHTICFISLKKVKENQRIPKDWNKTQSQVLPTRSCSNGGGSGTIEEDT
jgi:hypothetical protein